MDILRTAYFILIALLAIVLDTTVIGLLFQSVPGAKPSILLAMVVLLGLFTRPREGAIYAFIFGFIEDAIHGQIMGLFMFNRVAIYMISFQLARRLYSRSAGVQFGIIFLLTFADEMLYLILGSIFIPDVHFNWYIVFRALFNGAIGMVLFYAFKRLWSTSAGLNTNRMDMYDSNSSHF